MSTAISEEFKQYAEFSVRVDRFFNVSNIYGWHHEGLKTVYSVLPDYSKRQEFINRDDIDEDFKRFFMISSMTLNTMATTGLFSDDKNAIDNTTLGADALNFSFYTCYCFQWTLFENFIKKMLRKAIDANAVAQPVKDNLESLWGKTKKFLDYINSGVVFGESPFATVLPVMGYGFESETCTYADLDRIRELRNEFIHGIETPEILSEEIIVKQKRYERSMWILRLFAQNVQFDVQRLMEESQSRE